MIYLYCCKCGIEQELVRSAKDHTPTVRCECGRNAKQRITVPRLIPDIEPYRSMVTGERIRGRSHHKQHLREHELIEVGNEPIRDRKPKALPSVIPDLKKAIEELR